MGYWKERQFEQDEAAGRAREVLVRLGGAIHCSSHGGTWSTGKYEGDEAALRSDIGDLFRKGDPVVEEFAGVREACIAELDNLGTEDTCPRDEKDDVDPVCKTMFWSNAKHYDDE